MEVTNKSIIAVVAPVLITAVAGLVDNAMKWRSEMEQKEYDRQTRILDKIIAIPAADKRLAVANFYISTGTFSGKYLKELEQAVKIADALPQSAVVSSEPLASAEPTETEETPIPHEAMAAAPVPYEETMAEQLTELETPPPVVMMSRNPVPLIVPETIFSFDKSTESRKGSLN